MKLSKITLAAAVVIALISGLTACSGDDKTPLKASTGLLDNSGYNTLSFEWGKVDGARQYSYQLTETETGKVVNTAVTKFTKVTFTDLKPSTDYTLTVRAYAAMDSDNTSAEPIVLKGRTSDLIAVASPVPEMTRDVNSLIFQWTPVEGFNVYWCSLTASSGDVVDEGYVYEPYVTYENLGTDVYTFSVSTYVDAPGYIDSDPNVMTVDFLRQRVELWRANGKYQSSLLGAEWDATIVAYDDDSFDILSWYGKDGYYLTFFVDSESASENLKLPADKYSYDSSTGAYTVPTGLSNPAEVYVYTSGNRSAMDGDRIVGNVSLAVSDGSKQGVDRLTWAPGAFSNVTISIYSNSTQLQAADDCQATVIYEDGHYKLMNFFGCEWPITFTFPTTIADGRQYDLKMVDGTYVSTGTGYCCLLDPVEYARDPDGYYTHVWLDNYEGTGATETFAFPTIYAVPGYTYGKYDKSSGEGIWHIRICFDGMMESNGWNWTWFDAYFDMPDLVGKSK